MSISQKRKIWKKNLYENQNYPDNYTAPTFLKELRKNVHVPIFTIREAFVGATRLNQQISIVTIFLIIFYSMHIKKISPEDVLLRIVGTTGVGYFIYRQGFHFSLSKFKEDFKTVLSVFVFGYLFCPILHTLTDSISTDSIYSTTFFVMFLHLLTFDYGINGFVVSKAISLNAAIFGAICLASRLSSSFHAFVLLVSSIVFFALGPLLLVRYRAPYWLFLIGGSCMYFLYQISLSIFVTYLLVLIFINFLCPLIFIYLQKYKNNIHGPWDEAILKDIVSETT